MIVIVAALIAQSSALIASVTVYTFVTVVSKQSSPLLNSSLLHV